MERLLEDALHVQTLLPWIESDEDIINFMRKIPLDKSHLRHQLTLSYFLKQRDTFGDGFDKQIEDDAREIVIVLPDTSYKEIKDRLAILGSMPNRKEVVLRQLLHEKRDLDRIVREIDINNTNKRKAETHLDNVFDLDSNRNETIKIKIRKREGSLEVVSSIKKEATSPLKAQSSNETPSSTSISSSTSHSESSSPDSTVPSTSGGTHNNNDPCPEFTAILQNIIDRNLPSTSGTVMPAKYNARSSVRSINNNDTVISNVSNVRKRREAIEAKQSSKGGIKSVITKVSNSPNNNDIENESEFNLIDFLQELTHASEKKILNLCKHLKLNLNKRPGDDILTYIVNELFEDVIEVKSDNSSIDCSTEEYQLPDNNNLENISEMLENYEDTIISNDVPENSTLNPNAKEFKLKPPVLTVKNKSNSNSSPVVSSNEDFTLPKGGSSSPMTIIKPPRLILQGGLREPTTIPAMPKMYIDKLQNNRPFDINTLIGPSNAPVDLTVPSDVPPTTINLVGSESDVLEAGPSNIVHQKKRVVDEKLVLKLIEMFPDACPDYIRDVCDGKQWANFDDVVTIMLSNEGHPKRPQRIPSPVKEVDPEEQFEILKELLPDADPTYLRMQCEKYANDDKGLKEFINQAMELHDYPTMKEYLRKQQLSAQQRQYTTEFNIEHFIQLFPDPEKTFNDPKRIVKVDAYESQYLNLFFRNKFDKISARMIQQVLSENGNKIITSNQALEQLIKNNNVMKSRRSKRALLPENMQNIPLLQELAYLTHQQEIETYLQEKQKREEQERLEAKKNGLLQSCNCCYDEEVMPKDTFSCPNGCNFCRDCIKKSCEVAMGDGKTEFSCLADCTGEFTLQTLQNILPPKMFSKLAQKKALAEIKAAGIEELETCPFCDFASIPNEADKIFRCLNPDCMKESCRNCKEPNHVPLKCEELEKDQDVKARTYIENKMTEALLRKCWKCGTSFFKEEGCNKMTCSCGAKMCYLCQQPVKDYSHFNGIGGDKFNLCPLYSDTNKVNRQNVMGAAAAAKAEVDTSKLKIDPTADIEDHYKKRAKQLPREPHMELLHINVPGPMGHLYPHRPGHRHPQQLPDPAQRIIDAHTAAVLREQRQRLLNQCRVHFARMQNNHHD